MHDFYAELLRLHAKNEDNFKENEYRLLLDSFEDYVKEMYYCPYCLKEFTRQEYEALPVNASGERYHVHDEKHIPVIKVQGTKAYFDGQSTIKLNKNLPMINFDISGVPSTERPIITAVCENFIDEQFIKTNSIDPRKARKLIVYMDEVHEQFPYPGLRQFINRFYRVARKRHVAPWIITQSIVDLYKYPDLEEIVKTTETLFLFKHSDKDKDKIKEAVKLTDSQIEGIIGLSGDEQSEGKRPGECCLVDIPTKQAAFLQVDYLKEAEQYIVETDREVLADLIGGNKGA